MTSPLSRVSPTFFKTVEGSANIVSHATQASKKPSTPPDLPKGHRQNAVSPQLSLFLHTAAANQSPTTTPSSSTNASPQPCLSPSLQADCQQVCSAADSVLLAGPSAGYSSALSSAPFALCGVNQASSVCERQTRASQQVESSFLRMPPPPPPPQHHHVFPVVARHLSDTEEELHTPDVSRPCSSEHIASVSAVRRGDRSNTHQHALKETCKSAASPGPDAPCNHDDEFDTLQQAILRAEVVTGNIPAHDFDGCSRFGAVPVYGGSHVRRRVDDKDSRSTESSDDESSEYEVVGEQEACAKPFSGPLCDTIRGAQEAKVSISDGITAASAYHAPSPGQTHLESACVRRPSSDACLLEPAAVASSSSSHPPSMSSSSSSVPYPDRYRLTVASYGKQNAINFNHQYVSSSSTPVAPPPSATASVVAQRMVSAPRRAITNYTPPARVGGAGGHSLQPGMIRKRHTSVVPTTAQHRFDDSEEDDKSHSDCSDFDDD